MTGVPLFGGSKAQAAGTEAYNWRNVVTGAGGGFVPGIIFNETQPNLIYARTDIGGAYRWNQSTSSWVSISDSVGWVDWNKNGVDALATDPVDPNRVYMATGTYTNDWDTNGQIMRSTDQGNTWQVTPLPFKVGGNMPGRSMGERLVIDPNKNSVLFFGTRSGNGLWKSTDYGVTWSKVTSFPNPGTYIQNPDLEYGNDPVGLAWITFDKSTGSAGNATQTIYVGVADTGNSVYKSTDGGATWAAVPGQPTGYLPHHGVLASTGYLYISYSDGVGPYDGAKGDVWKLNTATGAWTKISPVPSSSTDNYYGYGGLAVDKQHPNTIMVATLNSWWPDANIFRSTDGGTTWTGIWEWNGYPSRTLRYAQDISAAPWLTFGKADNPPEPGLKLGWMIGDLEIDPFNSSRMMYGTGATIYGTNNLAAWDSGGTVNISVMAKGIEEMAVLGLVSPPSGAHLLSAIGDVSGFRHDDLTTAPTAYQTNPRWATTYGIDFAESNPSFVVRVGMADYQDTTEYNPRSIGISTDGGTTWYKANSEPSGTAGGGTVAVAADGSSILWSTSDKGVYYSKTNGNSWTASTGVPALAKIASDRVNKNKFYAFYEGTFYISTDGGATFAATGATGLPTNNVAGLLPNEAQISLKTVPGIEGDIWFAGGNETEGIYGLWHSTNSGSSFTKLSNVQEADLIGLGKAAPGQTYMALYTVAKIDGVRGVFRSDDAGASWVRINDDQHQYARINMAITGDPRVYGRVYLGTNGRGILVADPVNAPVTGSSISPTTATFDKNAANQADVGVTLTLNGNTLSSIKNGSATLVSDTDYAVSGTTVTIKKAYLAAQPVGTTTLTFAFSAGSNASLAVTVVNTSVANSTISPTTATFDKNAANQADVSVALTLNGNTLSSIKNGSATLVSGTDYAVSGTTVTIKKAYLAAQPVGTTTLTFAFSAGSNASLAVTVVNTSVANSTISPTTATFDKNAANQADVGVTLTLNGNTLSSIKNGSATLVSGTDYAVSGTTVTIKKAYLAAQPVGTTTLTFAFSAGSNAALAISIADTTPSSGGALKVQMFNGTTAASTQSINPRIRLVNTGTTAVSLSNVKIRYYYTIDGDKAQSFFCDWATAGSANVTGAFTKLTTAKTGADYYLEIGFASGAGSLAAGASTDLQIRFSKTDWTNYSQSDDYSYDSADTAYVDWTKAPAYLSGSLAWGVEP
nr:X2-like carbohydrate binding domain-containing protein [Cohnella sp. AR92]